MKIWAWKRRKGFEKYWKVKFYYNENYVPESSGDGFRSLSESVPLELGGGGIVIAFSTKHVIIFSFGGI